MPENKPGFRVDPGEQPPSDERSWIQKNRDTAVVGTLAVLAVSAGIWAVNQIAGGGEKGAVEALPGRPFREIVEDAEERNTTSTVYLTDIDPKVLLNPDKAKNTVIERAEIQVSGCAVPLSGTLRSGRNIPTVLLRDKDGVGTGEYVPFRPSAAHIDMMSTLRDHYRKELSLSADVRREPLPLSGDSLFTIFAEIGRSVCGNMQENDIETSKLTSHRTLSAETAGPLVDNDNGIDTRTWVILGGIVGVILWARSGFSLPKFGQ